MHIADMPLPPVQGRVTVEIKFVGGRSGQLTLDLHFYSAMSLCPKMIDERFGKSTHYMKRVYREAQLFGEAGKLTYCYFQQINVTLVMCF